MIFFFSPYFFPRQALLGPTFFLFPLDHAGYFYFFCSCSTLVRAYRITRSTSHLVLQKHCFCLIDVKVALTVTEDRRQLLLVKGMVR
jgi:hypothetical protein